MYQAYGLKLNCEENEKLIVDEVEAAFSKYDGVPNIVVDIGAHLGSLALMAAKRGATMVLAFEPIPQNFKRLVENITLNNCWQQIHPIEMAVSSSEGISTLYTRSGFNSGQNSTMYKPEIFNLMTKAPCLSLSTIVRMVGSIDYLKIDIEGGEFPLLLGQSTREMHLTMKSIKYLNLEIHDPANKAYFRNPNNYSVEQMQTFLREHGFDESNSYIRVT